MVSWGLARGLAQALQCQPKVGRSDPGSGLHRAVPEGGGDGATLGSRCQAGCQEHMEKSCLWNTVKPLSGGGQLKDNAF